MSGSDHQQYSENRRQKRLAMWMAGIFAAVGMGFFGLGNYIVYQIQAGVFDLADIVLMPAAFLMLVFGLISNRLIKRDRYELGVWILYFVVVLPPVAAAFVMEAFGLIAAIYLLVFASLIIYQVMQKSARRIAFVAAGVALLAILAVELWNPSFRMDATIVPNFSFMMMGLMIIGTLAYFVRQAWRGNVRTKLIVSFLLVTIVPMVIVGLIVAFRTYSLQVPQALEIQSQVARRVAGEVENFIRERENELLSLTEIRGLEELTLQEQEALLTILISAQNLYEGLVLLDGDGQELIRLSQIKVFSDDELVSRAGAEEYEAPKDSEETYFGSVTFDEASGEPLMLISVPLFDLRSGKLTNVLVANFRFKTVWDIMAKEEGAGSVYLIDRSARVIAHANPTVVLQGTKVDLPSSNSFTAGLDGSNVALARERIDINDQIFDVVAELPSTEALRLEGRNLLITLIIVVVMIAAATMFGTFAARLLTTPISELADVAQAISEGDLNREAEVVSTDEIGTLAAAFNTMTAQMRDLIASLERQVADRTRALETSSEVSRRLSTILDQDQLVSEVVEQLQSAFGFYHAQIYLFDEAGQNLVMAGGTGEAGAQMLADGHSLPVGKGLVGQAAQTNLMVHYSAETRVTGWLPNPLLPETKAELAVPISIGQEVLGVLDVQHDAPSGFAGQDVELIQAIASQVAIAVQNARAYTQARKQAQREATIAAIGSRIQNAVSVDDALQIAISELGQALGAKVSQVELNLPENIDL